MKALGKKILAVMKEVDHIVKDARNEFHKYDYVSDAAVVRAVRAAMINNNLVMFPHYFVPQREGDLTILTGTYHVLDVDSGEFIVQGTVGYGSDKGDKGIYKAMTGMEKTFLLKLLLIPTNDDPEKEKDAGPENAAPKSWPKPELSTKLEKPAGPLAQALSNLVDKTIGVAVNPEQMVDEIIERLNQEADGDEQRVVALLKDATIYTPKGTTKQKWLEPDDLMSVAKSRPQWIERIHAKVVTN